MHTAQNNTDSVLNRFEKLVYQNLDNHLYTIPEICKELATNRNKLSRCIIQKTQMKPIQRMRFIRLSEAHNLLLKGGLSVSDVAYSTGFNNLSYFSRCYKQAFGTLPSQVS